MAKKTEKNEKDKKKPIYKRIILKISGEAFKTKGSVNAFSMHEAERLAEEIGEIHKSGVEIAIIIGAGNIARGRDFKNIPQPTADTMGMIATAINTIFLQEILEKNNEEVRTQTAIAVGELAPFMRKKASAYLKNRKIVLLAGGTGNTYCTTDYAAALRALELNADAILKGTKVNGIYKTYPTLSNSEKPIPSVAYKKAREELNIKELLDQAALDLLIREKAKIPIHIFNILEKGNLKSVVFGEKIGSIITP